MADRTQTPNRHGLRIVREEEGSPYPKASLWLRGGARVLDLAVAWGLFRVAGPAGVVLALLYLLFADGLMHGQSIGKRVLGVKVVFLPTRMAARYRDSVLRNAPLGLVIVLGMMPDVGGVVFVVAGAIIGTVEAFWALRDPLGLRLGDSWAQTQVIDGKVIAGQSILRPTEAPRAPGRVMMEGPERPGTSGRFGAELELADPRDAGRAH